MPGGDFIAELGSVHNKVLAPTPINSTSTPVTPPGTLPASGFIPTVHATTTTIVPLAKVKATKAAVIHGKATPHVIKTAAPKAGTSAREATKSN